MSASPTSQEVPLMNDYKDDLESEEFKAAFRSAWRPRRGNVASYSIFACTTILPWLITCCLLFWIGSRYQLRGPHSILFPQLTYSPVQHLLQYEPRVFELGFGLETTEYQGEPSPELDKRWNSLYEFGVSKIPKEQAKNLVNQTIMFPHDKDHEYIIELDIFHQLHCLNVIRKALRPEYYKHTMPGADGEDELLGVHHVDHCVDSIRQSLMCTFDVSALTWQWSKERQMNVEKATVVHTCRNFDRIREWAWEHTAKDPFDSYFREPNDPLDPETWTEGYSGK